jgi:hypothetical protein
MKRKRDWTDRIKSLEQQLAASPDPRDSIVELADLRATNQRVRELEQELQAARVEILGLKRRIREAKPGTT